MKHRTRLIVTSLLLLGTLRIDAADCATRNVAGASLLVPYFRVALGDSQGDDISEGGVDTLVSVTNRGGTPVITQVTVWNKYGKPVFAFNLPLWASDVAFFRMKDVLNGRLNVNPNTQRLTGSTDACGLDHATGAYAPVTGFGRPLRYVRFANPDPEDASKARSFYPTPAFGRDERLRIWDSLDESGDVRSVRSPGANVLDVDNPACEGTSDGRLEGDLSGSLTIDVLNYCTTRLPDDPRWFANDILATTGWEASGFTPNTLMGDVFYVDGSVPNGVVPEGNVSGDSVAALAFDPKLSWTKGPTFYARYSRTEAPAPAGVPAPFRFEGDGRRALGTKYAFRFLNDRSQGLRSWLIVWRSDLVPAASSSDKQADLCLFRRDCLAAGSMCGHPGSLPALAVGLRVFDNDRGFVACASPSVGCPPTVAAFLQTQRIDLLENGDFISGNFFKGGYAEITLPGDPLTNQAFVSVQHSGPGLALSVGHAATQLRPSAPCKLSRTPSVSHVRPPTELHLDPDLGRLD